jgi:polyisoprenoid-binding protein YceI
VKTIILALMGMSVALSPVFASTTDTYSLDASTSKVKWEGRKKVVDSKHYGTIDIKSGEVKLQGDQLKGGTLVIDMTTIRDEDLTDEGYNTKLVGHLKSEDFFDVQKFPEAKFVFRNVKAKKGPEGATHEVTGDLTIKGKTHPVTFPANIEIKDGMVHGKAQLSIDRTQWNIRYGSDKFFKSLGDKVIHDEIKFDLDLAAKKS